MTATPGLDEWAARQEHRCAGCGMHLTAQGCICAGQAAKSRILTAVNDSTPDDVKARIDAAIMRHARTGLPFSANACRSELADIDGSRIGPRFASLAKAGVIEHVGYEPSTDPRTRHDLKVWQRTTSDRKAA